ncbi:MAG: chemotaxis protein CheD [Spirochaetaceae bacterium]|nr:MAG: chemotaxis protein CheD [Spirochaetaceae bacterium]
MILHPGEFYASGEDLIISTVLGSCIAVVFYDPVRRIGAMNHFMLPGTQRDDGYFDTEGGKYGMYAMELAINEMLKLGARREQLRCKVFGGAHVLRGGPSNEASVPQNNINFAFNYLETERINVESSDVGGTVARKVLLFPQTFKVLLKRITGTLITDVEKEEKDYLRRIKTESKKPSEPTLF